MSDRAQTFTLEAFVAAVLLLTTVAFALQAVSVSSNTASAAGAELRGQQAGLAVGVLDQGAENGTLQATLLYWNETEGRFYDAGEDGHYVARDPPTTFGSALSQVVDGRQVRYNVDLYFENASGEPDHQRLVESGTPDDDAVRVVETVTLYDDTRLVDANETARPQTLGNLTGNSTFYAPDRSAGPVYTVVRVEVVLWET